jgi:hypothetical protein
MQLLRHDGGPLIGNQRTSRGRVQSPLSISCPSRFAPATLPIVSRLLEGTLDVTPVHVPKSLEPLDGSPLRASGVLEHVPPGTIVIVENEISTRWLARALGWSDVRRGRAVVTVYKLDAGQVSSGERLAKLVAHEAGHLLGLRHCSSPSCIAGAIQRHVELDALRGFCPRCQRRLDSST